jgi:nucleoid DNA-binding protein
MPKNYNKTDLTDFISGKTKLSKKDCKAVLDVLFDKIPKITKSGGQIKISGFGTFKEGKTKARTMKLSAKQKRMLKTKANSKRIPAGKHLSFSSSKSY